MNAETIAEALGGRPSGDGWMARCPAHEDHTPSLSITEAQDGKVLVRCFANCEQTEVIAALRDMGLWPEGRGRRERNIVRPSPVSRPIRRPGQDRSSYALRIWRASVPAQGTLVETYLRSRGIAVNIPETLRFHPQLPHGKGSQAWPAMVALVTRGLDGTPVAIHRTFLARNGHGKAPVEPQRKMLGPCAGGVIRLAEAGPVLMVGEGVETCLSAMQAMGLPAWVALSTSGLRCLQLPEVVGEVIVLADGDGPGQRAAGDAAANWARQKRLVRIARAPSGFDFNDLLQGLDACASGEGS